MLRPPRPPGRSIAATVGRRAAGGSSPCGTCGSALQYLLTRPPLSCSPSAVQEFKVHSLKPMMLKHPAALLELGYPLVAAWSRKSSLGAVMATGDEPLPVSERLPGSLAAALLAVERGARIVRVHDVRETVGALRVWQAAQP